MPGERGADIMGGTAFGAPCRRLGAGEHEEMTREVCLKLRQLGISPHPVPSYREKADHGDIDILAEGAEGRGLDIVEKFQAEKSNKNGDCLSLLWKGAQVDIVSIQDDLVDAALGYFSWPDLGNFLGRIAKAGGFRYGHRGLFKWVRAGDGGRTTAVEVSSCTKDIFGFFGVDHSRWEEGFDKPIDIYCFAASSPLFSRRIFEHQALDHRTRVRNRKRPVYAGLLGWASGRGLRDFDFEACPSEWWDQRVMEHFGQGWTLERDRWLDEESRREEAGEKFNGSRVRNLTGLNGPELGDFIQHFKAGRAANFRDWVIGQSQPSIDRAILDYFDGRRSS